MAIHTILILLTLLDSVCVVSPVYQVKNSYTIDPQAWTQWLASKSSLRKGEFVLHFQRETGCWTLYNEEKKPVFDSCFKDAKVWKEGFVRLQYEHALGGWRKEGNQKVPFVYKDLKYQDNILIGKKYNFHEIRNDFLRTELSIFADEIKCISSNLYSYRVDSKYGLGSFLTGRTLTPAIFDSLVVCSDSVMLTRNAGRWGAVNKYGRYIVEADKSQIVQDSLGMLRYTLNGKQGLAYPNGKTLLPPEYEAIGPYSEGLFPVQKNQLWGLVDVQNKELVTPFFSKIGVFQHGLAPAGRGVLVGIIDERAKWYIFPEFQYIDQVSDSVWIGRKRGGYLLFFPKKGEFSREAYMHIEHLGGGYFKCMINGKYGLLQGQGLKVLDYLYDDIWWYPSEDILVGVRKGFYSIFYPNGNLKVFMNYPFSYFGKYKNGMARVCHQGKYGFIDKDGLLLVSTQYDEARDFKNGFGAIRIGDKWGFINPSEVHLVSPNYEEVMDFESKVAPVKRNGLYGFIDKSGKEIGKCMYEEVLVMPNQTFVVKAHGKVGVVNAQGVETVNPIYKYLGYLNKSHYKSRMYRLYGIVDLQNRQLIPDKYHEIEYYPAAHKYVFTLYNEWQPIQLYK